MASTTPTNGNDHLQGTNAGDLIDGLAGDDTLRGKQGDDTLIGGADNDEALGQAGADLFIGGEGNDAYFGEGKAPSQILPGSFFTDTVSYLGTGIVVTLGAAGEIIKSNGGTDTIAGIEVIEGEVGVLNTIGTGTANSGQSNFIIDLSTDSLVVANIGGNPSINASFTVRNFVNVVGTANNDQIGGDGGDNDLAGGDGDDTIFGSAGNDRIQGNAGEDVLDYTGTGLAVEITSAGIYTKTDAGGVVQGVDTVGSFDLAVPVVNVLETVIGDIGPGLVNVLNAAGQGASVAIDLDAQTIAATAGGLTFGFTVINFRDGIGSDLADTFTGDGQDNTFTGGLGSDTFFASAGSDTYIGDASPASILPGTDVDSLIYGVEDGPITLLSNGVIEKGFGGTDTIVGFERIVGSSDRFNAIDGRVDGPQTTRFEVNLARDELKIIGIPGTGPVSFEVVNFDQIFGTDNNDVLVGNNDDNGIFAGEGNDQINGRRGNDNLGGGAGFDNIRGGAGDDTITGGGSNDTLIGNGGADTFVLQMNSGTDRIEKFREADFIDLTAFAGIGFDDLNFTTFNDGGETVEKLTIDGIANVQVNFRDTRDGFNFDASDFIFAGVA